MAPPAWDWTYHEVNILPRNPRFPGRGDAHPGGRDRARLSAVPDEPRSDVYRLPLLAGRRRPAQRERPGDRRRHLAVRNGPGVLLRQDPDPGLARPRWRPARRDRLRREPREAPDRLPDAGRRLWPRGAPGGLPGLCQPRPAPLGERQGEHDVRMVARALR